VSGDARVDGPHTRRVRALRVRGEEAGSGGPGGRAVVRGKKGVDPDRLGFFAEVAAWVEAVVRGQGGERAGGVGGQ